MNMSKQCKQTFIEKLPVDGGNSVRSNFRKHKLLDFLALHSQRQQALNGTERQRTFSEIISTYHTALSPTMTKRALLNVYKVNNYY